MNIGDDGIFVSLPEPRSGYRGYLSNFGHERHGRDGDDAMTTMRYGGATRSSEQQLSRKINIVHYLRFRAAFLLYMLVTYIYRVFLFVFLRYLILQRFEIFITCNRKVIVVNL